MSDIENFFVKAITKRQGEGLFRELRTTDSLADFCSNDYLGLARSSALFDIINARMETIKPMLNGATGSRLLSGNTSYTEIVEQKLSAIFKSDAALIFNSGYTANMAVLSSIPQKDDTIIYDELAHACIKDGARLSLAKRYSFRHNNLHDLENKIQKATGNVFIVVESIYSMDGDECPLVELTKLAEKYNASVIVDEAHSTGVKGEGGSGLAVSLNVHEKITARVYTFGKAMGIHGACVTGSKSMINYLINFARPFIYTTALSPHSIASIESAFTFLSENIYLQKDLQKKIEIFCSEFQSSQQKPTSQSAIQTALFPGNDNAKKASRYLQTKGFDVRPILSPTVAKGTERLRICLHSFNSQEEISTLCKSLEYLTKNDS
jgi:8-amino-7-oxononanoate synthase